MRELPQGHRAGRLGSQDMDPGSMALAVSPGGSPSTSREVFGWAWVPTPSIAQAQERVHALSRHSIQSPAGPLQSLKSLSSPQLPTVVAAYEA